MCLESLVPVLIEATDDSGGHVVSKGGSLGGQNPQPALIEKLQLGHGQPKGCLKRNGTAGDEFAHGLIDA